MDPRIKVGGLFFDSAPVLQSLREDERKVLSRFGYFVFKDARQSIRKRRGPSKPGQAPTDQTGILKRFIFFAFDPEARSVVVGAARLSGGQKGPAPEALENEGKVFNAALGRWVRIKRRPYMAPAFNRQLSKPLPPPWGK